MPDLSSMGESPIDRAISVYSAVGPPISSKEEPHVATTPPQRQVPKPNRAVIRWLLDSDPSIRWQVMLPRAGVHGCSLCREKTAGGVARRGRASPSRRGGTTMCCEGSIICVAPASRPMSASPRRLSLSLRNVTRSAAGHSRPGTPA